MRIQRKPGLTVAYLGGIPTLPEPFVYSLARMVAYTAEVTDIPVELDRATVSFHAYARNVLAKRFKGEWLLQLDTDHEFDPDLLVRLLNTAQRIDAVVLSGFYQYRTPPYQPNAYLWSKTPGLASPIGWWDATRPVLQVDATGGGCLLVHRSVFDRIRHELREEPFDVRRPFDHPADGALMGEDLSFFDRLRQLKIPAWLDTRVQCKHLRWHAVDLADFDREACKLDDGGSKPAVAA